MRFLASTQHINLIVIKMRKKILFKFVNRPGLIPGYLIESKSTLYPDGYYVEYKVTNDDGRKSVV